MEYPLVKENEKKNGLSSLIFTILLPFTESLIVPFVYMCEKRRWSKAMHDWKNGEKKKDH